MEVIAEDNAIRVSAFVALTVGIVVYFTGVKLTGAFGFLRRYSIPEPVSGGIAAALLAWAAVALTGRDVVYDLAARDFLLVYFFTAVGLNARLADLVRGGPILALLLALTVGFMIVQAAIGIAGARAFGLPSQAGVMLGTGALIGGHGTAIAWGPTIQDRFGVAGGAELGVAMATVGLIAASLLGGPIARFLIERDRLAAPADHGDSYAGDALDEPGEDVGPITNADLLLSILWLNVAVMIGVAAHEALEATGAKLPLFVPCLLSAILLSNTAPRLLPRLRWPAGTPALGLVSEFSLSVFLSMSLMSMQLWTLADHAGVLAATLAAQALAAVLFIVFVVYRAVGRSYFGAVIASGFTGVTLGATPTAIANMTAVTQRYGPAPLAFIVLPLISAFFVDIANAFVIQFSLRF